MDENNKYEIRRKRLKQLIDSRCKGNQSEFATSISRAANYISRLLKASNLKGSKRLGEDLASEIEHEYGLEEGWLSKDPGDDGQDVPTDTGWPFSFPRARFDRLSKRQKIAIENIILSAIDGYDTVTVSSKKKRRRKAA